MVEKLPKHLPVPKIELPTEEVKWSTVAMSEVFERKLRLEASVYGIEGKHAREVLSKCRWQLAPITGNKGMATAYHRPRFKRIFVERSDLPIYQPSQVTEIYPKPSIWISKQTRTNIDALRVKRNQVLITCSGTIGKCTIVNKTLDNKIFSHDLFRVTTKNESDAGYLYTFLRTKIGQVLLKTNNYGAVVSHVEPEHLDEVSIPNPSPIIKTKIHNLVMDSFNLRDESNELLDEAHGLLIAELKLPSIEDLRPSYFVPNNECKNFNVRLSDLDGRLESTYHKPILKVILDHLKIHAKEVTALGDSRVSKGFLAPGRFKRVYVGEGYGVAFFGGKELFQLDPRGEKFLSLRHHSKRIKDELTLRENMIMVTCSGTVGKIAIVPKHWDGLAANQHILRIVPASKSLAGYIYAWLQTDFGKELITRFIYGAVVDEIDERHLARVPIPLLQNTDTQQKISDLVLTANQKRFEAFSLEQKAIKLMEDKVIYAEKS